ncbi:restriction endonuclease [Clostridium sp.]
MDYTDNFETFDEWFNLIKQNENVDPRFRIPCQEWLEAYIQNIDNRSESDVKELLRYLLFPYTRGIDRTNYSVYNAYNNRLNNINENDARIYLEQCINIEMYKRIGNNQSAWEGLTWILQLLPFHPYKAIKALNCYFEAEDGCMPDDRMTGINQCIEIIEAKFIYTNKGLENSILQLTPREFELLIEILYEHIGYKTILTPATRDGGKDIIAEIDREDGKETVYVECKRYKTSKLTREKVGYFCHACLRDNVNRGVLFCTGEVNKKLRDFDPRIKIWTLEEIIILLNAHIGSDWDKRLKLLIENQKRKNKNKRIKV